MRIDLSSTEKDLRDYRFAIHQALRRMGHDVIGMERYVPEATTPLTGMASPAAVRDGLSSAFPELCVRATGSIGAMCLNA